MVETRQLVETENTVNTRGLQSGANFWISPSVPKCGALNINVLLITDPLFRALFPCSPKRAEAFRNPLLGWR